MGNGLEAVIRRLRRHVGRRGPAPAHLTRLRQLGIWAPTAFGALLLALTLALQHTLPLSVLILLILGVSAAGAAGFSWFVFSQIQEQEEEIVRRTHELEELSQALAAAMAQKEGILQAAGEGIYGLDAQGILTFVNPAGARMIGWEVKDLIGKPMHEIPHHTRADGTPYPADDCPIYAAFRDGIVHHRDSEIFWRKDGTSFPVEYTSTPIREGSHLVGAVVTFRDITERKQDEEALRVAHGELEQKVNERTEMLAQVVRNLEDEITERHEIEARLRHSEEQLHVLSAHLLSLQEAERARIAREVHDELGQALTALKLDLAWLAQRLPRTQAAHHKIRTMTRLVEETIHSVRRLATELRPAVLDHLGLVPALDWLVKAFQERTGLTCSLRCTPAEIALDHDRATAIFRICQEALTNVARHAEARRVSLRLTRSGDRLIVEVEDDGLGVPAVAVADPKSIGLMGMRERVLPWNGQVEIQGGSGQGTLVRVILPLDEGSAGSVGDRP